MSQVFTTTARTLTKEFIERLDTLMQGATSPNQQNAMNEIILMMRHELTEARHRLSSPVHQQDLPHPFNTWGDYLDRLMERVGELSLDEQRAVLDAIGTMLNDFARQIAPQETHGIQLLQQSLGKGVVPPTMAMALPDYYAAPPTHAPMQLHAPTLTRPSSHSHPQRFEQPLPSWATKTDAQLEAYSKLWTQVRSNPRMLRGSIKVGSRVILTTYMQDFEHHVCVAPGSTGTISAVNVKPYICVVKVRLDRPVPGLAFETAGMLMQEVFVFADYLQLLTAEEEQSIAQRRDLLSQALTGIKVIQTINGGRCYALRLDRLLTNLTAHLSETTELAERMAQQPETFVHGLRVYVNTTRRHLSAMYTGHGVLVRSVTPQRRDPEQHRRPYLVYLDSGAVVQCDLSEVAVEASAPSKFIPAIWDFETSYLPFSQWVNSVGAKWHLRPLFLSTLKRIFEQPWASELQIDDETKRFLHDLLTRNSAANSV